MSDSLDNDWKKSMSFPINYESASSDDDFDTKDVVFRNPQHSSKYLLADCGDGAEADLLGSTPPRSRIRDKERGRKNHLDSTPGFQRLLREKKDAVDASLEHNSPMSDRLKKRSSLKLLRSRARDSKQDLTHDVRADSLPSPNPMTAVPTLVESCNRFMSLTSRPKNREAAGPDKVVQRDDEVRWRCDGDEELPPSRVSFHKTFSLLINMGNIEKGCKRAISREEQVWQNELKDLIWLELQAKLAGRSLAQQDAYLCAQRNIVPKIIKNIFEYKFVNKNPCSGICQRPVDAVNPSVDLAEESENPQPIPTDDEQTHGCLSFDCQLCSDAIGQAMHEVGTLLDSFYNAVKLYPSSRNMNVEQPEIATQVFQDRIKAMCLWYNTALHMRLRMLALRRTLRSIRLKGQRRARALRKTPESRPTQVRFDVSGPSDSSNSDTTQDGSIKDELNKDEVDFVVAETNELRNGSWSPETEGEEDEDVESAGPLSSVESGYVSGAAPAQAVHMGALHELTHMRLLDKCAVSLYRDYHREILKTQGVRRCMMFIQKMRMNLLDKVYLTLEKPEEQLDTPLEDESGQVFEDPAGDKSEYLLDEDAINTYELRRYGCWSPECISMRLPSYCSHFLLLSSMCMEVVHDYLSFRLEARPEHPSCLTVKQLIHELREGLDIASEMRADFALHVECALAGPPRAPRPPGPPSAPRPPPAANQLLLLTRTFDATVETMLKQYLSYLTTMSETEHMPRSCLQAEWAFTAQLAKRIKCAAVLAPITFSNITCNQLKRLLNQFEGEFGKVINGETDIDETDKHTIYRVCRWAQSRYASWREAALQAAQWARALALRLARAQSPAYLEQRKDIFNCLMAIRDFIVKHILFVLEKSKMSPNEDLHRDLLEAVGTRVRELLLQMFKLGFELHRELHRLVSPPAPRRPRPARADSVLDDGDGTVFDDRLFDNMHHLGENQPTQSSIELILSGDQEAARMAPKEDGVDDQTVERRASCQERAWAARVARAVIQFARCWMAFVLERCDRGRGLRPRWASQGLEFLMLACDPRNTKHLSEEEFEELKQLMDGCISHVIGSRPAPAAPSPRPRPRLPSPFPSNNSSREGTTPPTPPPEEHDPLSYMDDDFVAHRRRVVAAAAHADGARDAALQKARAVGRVVRSAAPAVEPRLRQLAFKWQRGLKIGAGSFGKVYTVVNTESGQLLAMKELAVGAGDRRALQRAANELRVLEGVLHPHLVRYYGCELHREEMLIFMELCVEGSLEALVATSGALAEHTVRRYTKQLLSAVRELHARSIAHRDIKSGNIFLTNEGHCLKLGDFGCAVKIRANTTAPGELQGFVGTQAYMAPEVFMRSSGHGRAADVWSLGCVVTEMGSGKRPFYQYDSNYQIMFLVGSGGRPEIPTTLSEEGQEFCLSCLTHDPDLRPKAETLSLHHFLMVKQDETDCNCETSYLIQ